MPTVRALLYERLAPSTLGASLSTMSQNLNFDSFHKISRKDGSSYKQKEAGSIAELTRITEFQ